MSKNYYKTVEGLKRSINKENFDKIYEAIKKRGVGYGI